MIDTRIPEDTRILCERFWSAESVRMVCVRHGLYTLGSNVFYNDMLSYVNEHKHPSVNDLFCVARNIDNWSDDSNLESVMFMLEREAITSVYKIKKVGRLYNEG